MGELSYGTGGYSYGGKSRTQLAREKKEQVRLRKEAAADRKVSKVIPKAMLAGMPEPVGTILREVVLEDMAEGISAMMERERNFSTPMAALLAGVVVHDQSAAHFDKRLDEFWSGNRLNFYAARRREVIIGAGLQAAIYSAVRAAKGMPRPLVLESRRRPGGAFSVSRGPSFYLNSRNRPGGLSLPAQAGALNVLPGAPLQPSDIDSSEYQTNAALAWSIRLALALYADVVPDVYVDEISPGPPPVLYALGDSMSAERIIVATGLGDTYKRSGMGDRVLTFHEFMGKMDEPFPLRGLRRVAVIGAGDSGKTAVEALTGQGPSSRWSTASIDWVDQIDWYGCRWVNCEDWEASNRSRYKDIGRLLPSVSSPDLPRMRRVRPFTERMIEASPGFECIYINERPYDLAIMCTGYETRMPEMMDGNDDPHMILNRVVARRPMPNVFTVGPAANIALSSAEIDAVGSAYRVDENRTALFRYASRTAGLAESLPL